MVTADLTQEHDRPGVHDMSLTIFPDLEQGTDEWLAARCGILTASVVGRLITPTLKVAHNETSRGLVTTLAAERITGHVDPVHVTPDMWRGVMEEPIARAAYAEHNTPVDEVGFMIRDLGTYRIGYSPDGLVGAHGLIEIKSRAQKKHVKTVLNDEVPPENYAQLQAGLFVSGRDWIDYVSFCGGMHLWVRRVYPDPEWFAAIETAATEFEEQVTDTVSDYLAAVADLPMTERTPDFAEVELKL